ncbi:PfkB family carbohydrate kinase [Rhodohalobacter sulfatireducens]|uniref:PfkB family carbohydrate kinase n=1 Tax=Rhodohalobacter sulfatireducens TaxID=2911366 RepID=A0ABS9KCW5_9BACT|nr:PfkB family carbohydrate kinase [Rhodohalobacter sulfatireducens]MCG2588701.1 PfkB family carbohydrate kinase [Rhodohalobacter sulfatireducens]
MYKTLSVGEVLWDIFPDYKKPGGSPANVAYHLHSLGTASLLLSRVGKDTNGDDLLDFLTQKRINCKLIQLDEEYPTGIVNVKFDEGEPSYSIEEPSAWDFIELTDALINQVNSLDAICFASLSQRNDKTKDTVQYLLSAVPGNCLKVFDLNLRPPFVDQGLIISSIQKSDIIKINEHEFKILAEWFGKHSFTDNIFDDDPNKIILLTEGENGSTMFTATNTVHENAHPISGEGDFVGVGDAFLACFTFLKLNQTPENKILSLSNQYAAFVASQRGGMPDIPESILEQIN